MKLQIVAAMVAMAVTSVAEAAEYVLQNDAVANAAAWSGVELTDRPAAWFDVNPADGVSTCISRRGDG